ncbi:hypothetical protein M436DRAFT_62253 [Aureobasidium namibiae CBS 147.97]|uniref:BTB domain-containing protein n=1 Tax=Aureobasidium namibiae CBS 147.97 TaxID=1043004 RepID=A0A074XJU0_9PEZI|nr:uncharacterized protein M436DRAFT_62253 [Aureobasidium namibiae CBS 147.97]KEQ74811.1 hypothetical protein M436DRAFT_62253 [Aureobasidium namibiae CBS 147.97]
MEVAHIAAQLALHTLDKPEHDPCLQMAKSPAILRCWTREQVRQIREDSPETVRIRVPHCDVLGLAPIDINKALLSRFSPYYKAAFHRGFSESAQKIFDMNISAVDMHFFKTWLRDGRLTSRWDKLTLEQTIRLYIFADYYDFPALRRTIMTKLVLDKYGDRLNTRFLTHKVQDYLSELPPASPLYQWLAMVWACHNKGYSYSSQAYRLENQTPEEFRNLLHSIRSDGPLPRVCKCCYHPCDYHEHESEQEWEMTCHVHEHVTAKPDPSTYRKSFEIP